MLEALLLVLLLATQDAPPPLALTPGETITGDLPADAGRVETPGLAERATRGVPGVPFRFAVGEPGPYVLVLESHAFDGYLVLRNAGGRVLAESDGGHVGRHARIDAELGTGSYTAEACSLAGSGPFALSLLAGPLAPSTGDAALELSDAEAALAWADANGIEGARRAQILERLARRLAEAGRLEEARGPLAEAVAVREDLADPKALARAGADLAALLARLGFAAEARVRADSALAILESERAAPSELIGAMRTLGNASIATGYEEDGLRRLETALELAATDVGESAALTTGALDDLLSALTALGRFAEARRVGDRHLDALLAELGSHPLTQALTVRMAEVAWRLADLDRARSLLEQALEMEGMPALDRARARHLLADVLLESGRARAALPVYEQTLPELEGALGTADPAFLDCALGRARALAGSGRDAARTELQRVIALHEAIAPGRAEVASALGELAGIELRAGSAEEARGHLLRARQVLEDLVGDDHPRLADVDLRLASLAILRGEPKLATRLLERAIEIGGRTLGDDHPLVAAAHQRLGELAHAEGRYDEAQDRYDRAAASLAATLGAHHARTTRAVAARVRLLADRGRTDEARALVSDAIAARAGQRWRAVTSPTPRDRFAALSAERELFDLLAGLDAGAEATTPRLGLFEKLVEWEARRGGDRFAGERAIERRLGTGAWRTLGALRAIELSTERVANLGITALQGDPTGRLRELRAAEETYVGELHRHLAPADPIPFERVAWSLPARSMLVCFQTMRAWEPAGGDGSTEALGSWREPHLVAWVVRREPARIDRIDLGPAETVRVVAQAFGNLVTADPLGDLPPEPPGGGSPESLLADLLWKPLAPLAVDVETLYLVPDALTVAIPFELLTSNGEFLIERRRFVRLGDPSELFPPAAARPEPHTGLLTVGGIDPRRRAPVPEEVDTMDAGARLGSRGAFLLTSTAAAVADVALRHTPWPDLPDSVAECDLVEQVHAELRREAGRLALRGPHGAPERLRYEAARHGVLHFATHAFLPTPGVASLWEPDPAAPRPPPGAFAPGALSGLVGSGADHGGGLLAAAEIAGLDLSRASLVLLTRSATRPGDPRAGEGFLGLVRSLLSAGAPTVIASRWPVPAPEARALLEAFYRNLWQEGLEPGGALRRAQLDRLAAARAEGRARPAAWASFALHGSPR